MSWDDELIDEITYESYDAADKPFDFVEEGTETVLVCESDPAIRSVAVGTLKDLGYHVSEASSAKDALKSMRFHIYDVIVVNESYEGTNADDNIILRYLNSLSMNVRRNIFVALISSRFRTMDNMAAFNRSVNMIVNQKNIDELDTVLKKGVAEYRFFYEVFTESSRKIGKV